MNDIEHSSTCERADDLVSVLYGEASERERRDFELHLKQCTNCRTEFAAFTHVRESIGEWRDEALSGFVSTHTSVKPVRKSALAAFRQFLDLSPMWLKGAVGFAAVVFCALAAVAFIRFTRPEMSLTPDEPARVATTNPDAVYTKQDLDRAVQQALAKAEREQRVDEPKPPVVAKSPRSRSSNVAKTARRPFSKAEREQLAAELRLTANDDDLGLDLLDDRR